MEALQSAFSVSAVLDGAVSIMSGPIGLLVAVVGLGPIVAKKGIALLHEAVR